MQKSKNVISFFFTITSEKIGARKKKEVEATRSKRKNNPNGDPSTLAPNPCASWPHLVEGAFNTDTFPDDGLRK